MHGMAAVNAAVRDAVRSAGAQPTVINVAASSLDRSPVARLGRLPRVLRGLARLALSPRRCRATLYMSVSGGWGQVYELLFVALARWRGMPVYLHHHSFAYLDQRSRLTGWLLRLAGATCVHVVLSPGMASRLRAQYQVKHAVAVSNTVFFLKPVAIADTGGAPRRRLLRLGLLSNLAEEKGVFLFLDLMAAVRDAELPLRGTLAGPFQDNETERQVRARLADLPGVEYVGPKYGAEKGACFASIDAFVFPTINDAEPLVLHEAMQRGIPVIAYGRGAILEVVGAESGLVVDPVAPFVPAAMDCLQIWLREPAALEAASRAAALRFSETYSASERRWRVLRDALVGGVAMSPVSDERTGSMSSKD